MGSPSKAQGLTDDEEVAALRALLTAGPRTNRQRPAALSPEKAPSGGAGNSATRLLTLLQNRDDAASLDEAEKELRNELETRERTFPSTVKAGQTAEHPDVLLSVTCLAMLLQAKNKLDEAKSYYERAMKGFEANYGPAHRDTLISVNNLAVLLKSMNRLSEAKPLYERVLAGDEAQLGPVHPHTLDSVYNLARLLQADGQVKEAIPLFQRELDGCVQQYGAQHNETRTSAANLYGTLVELAGACSGDEKEFYLAQATKLAADFKLEVK